MNSQPESSRSLDPSLEPKDPHCPVARPRMGSGQSAGAQEVGRMEPRSIPREWYTAQTPTLSASVRRGFSPRERCRPERLQLSEISAWMLGIAWRSGGEAAPCLSRD